MIFKAYKESIIENHKKNMFTINQYAGWKRGTDRPMGK